MHPGYVVLFVLAGVAFVSALVVSSVHWWRATGPHGSVAAVESKQDVLVARLLFGLGGVGALVGGIVAAAFWGALGALVGAPMVSLPALVGVVIAVVTTSWLRRRAARG